MSTILDNGLTYAVLLGVLAVEYFRRAPFARTIAGLTGVAARSLRTVRSTHISDHWKEIVLLRYARDMMIHTAWLAALLAGCLLLLVGPALCIDRVVAPVPSVIGVLSSLTGGAVVAIGALLYSGLRSRLAKH